MKIIHSAITDGLSGTAGTSTFMRSRSSKFSYRREWAQPARTIQNDHIGQAAKNIGMQVKEINPLAIEDLKQYAKKYKDIPYFGDKHKERASNWFAIWTMFLYKIAKTDGVESELRTGSIKSIMNSYGIGSVAMACALGDLPKVPGYEELDNEFYID